MAGTLNIGDASDDWAYDEAGFDLDDSVILTEFIVKTPLVIVVRLQNVEESKRGAWKGMGEWEGRGDVQIGLDRQLGLFDRYQREGCGCCVCELCCIDMVVRVL